MRKKMNLSMLIVKSRFTFYGSLVLILEFAAKLCRPAREKLRCLKPSHRCFLNTTPQLKKLVVRRLWLAVPT